MSVAPILDARLGISDPMPAMLMLPGPPTDISAIIFFIMPSMSIDREPMLPPPEPIGGKSEAKKIGLFFTYLISTLITDYLIVELINC